MSGDLSDRSIVSLSEVQAYVRVETGDEEALLAGLLRTATALCEQFLNQIVLARGFRESGRATGTWQRLPVQPVRSISGIEDDEGLPLAPDLFSVDLDRDGGGWVMLAAGTPFVAVGVAGLAADQNDVPEPVRQGVIRLTAHLYANRDGGAGEPPAAVTALWRPYRRLMLSC